MLTRRFGIGPSAATPPRRCDYGALLLLRWSGQDAASFPLAEAEVVRDAVIAVLRATP